MKGRRSVYKALGRRLDEGGKVGKDHVGDSITSPSWMPLRQQIASLIKSKNYEEMDFLQVWIFKELNSPIPSDKITKIIEALWDLGEDWENRIESTLDEDTILNIHSCIAPNFKSDSVPENVSVLDEEFYNLAVEGWVYLSKFNYLTNKFHHLSLQISRDRKEKREA